MSTCANRAAAAQPAHADGQAAAAQRLHLPASPQCATSGTPPLVQAVAKGTSKPLIVVLFHGGPLDVSEMLDSPRVGAILSAGMPGQHGAAAVADILVGAVAPSGARLLWVGLDAPGVPSMLQVADAISPPPTDEQAQNCTCGTEGCPEPPNCQPDGNQLPGLLKECRTCV